MQTLQLSVQHGSQSVVICNKKLSWCWQQARRV